MPAIGANCQRIRLRLGYRCADLPNDIAPVTRQSVELRGINGNPRGFDPGCGDQISATQSGSRQIKATSHREK